MPITMGSFLSYSNDSDSETHGFLRVNAHNVTNWLASFQVVSAAIGRGLVHIRSSHNRKFLRRRIEGDEILSPEADEPEEDQSRWSCTLFDPQQSRVGAFPEFRLFHVQSNLYATGMQDLRGVRFCRLSEADNSAIFYIFDLESLVTLPKHVAFKGHTGYYLRLGDDAKHRFISTDRGISECWYEVDTDRTGSVGIMSRQTNNYWHDRNGFISSLPREVHPSFTHFWAVKVNSNTVALRSISSNRFCAQTTNALGTDILTAAFTTLAASTRFTLEELVLSRRIYDTVFDLESATVYGETPIVMATASSTNNSAAEITVQLSFRIPFVGSGGVTAETEFSGSYEWGTTVTTQTTLESTYTATVPAYSSIMVSLLATRATCDVRFSYHRRDVLYDGRPEIFIKNDGLFTGINSYNFRYVTTTLRHSESTADLPNTVERLPDPSVDASIEEKLPLPELCGSTTPVMLTTTPELELSLLHVEEKTIQDAATLPLETNQEVGESLAW
ncbi:hypothetical protein ACLB2K_058255 [Fragaria x ananassa]